MSDCSEFYKVRLAKRRRMTKMKAAARLLVRVHRKDCSTTFLDNMANRPVASSEWGAYEITAPIAADAYHIEFGVQLVGAGALWIDRISMEYKPTPGN